MTCHQSDIIAYTHTTHTHTHTHTHKQTHTHNICDQRKYGSNNCDTYLLCFSQLLYFSCMYISSMCSTTLRIIEAHTHLYEIWMQTDQSDSFDQPINPPPNSYNSADGTRLACVSYTGTGNHKYSFKTTYMPTASYNSYDYCCLSHANIAICMIGTDRCFYICRIVYRRNSDRKLYECRHLTTQRTGWTK